MWSSRELRIGHHGCLLLALALAHLACGNAEADLGHRADLEPSPCSIFFAEEAERSGVVFRHFDATRAALLPEDNGSGLAFGDYDNDGFDDLYVVNLAGPVLMPRQELVRTRPPGRLFHNQGDGTFRDVTQESGLVHVGWDVGAIWLDVEGDGWLDLLLTGIDEVTLFRNRGDATFENRSREAGLGSFDCQAFGATAGDYDRDGDLDLYVPCYVDFPWERARNRELVGGRPATMTTPANYPPQPNLLLQNDGSGSFREVAAAAGVLDPAGRGLQAVFVDLDDDGWPDLYVANDQSFDRLYRNLGNGSFEDVAAAAGTRDPRAGMGVAIGDYDSDGALDLFLTHWVGEQNALYRNRSTSGSLLFVDRTYEEGLGPVDASWVGWGTGFFDFELDGDQDLLVINGSTIEDEWTLEVLSNPKMIPQPMRVYERREGGFADTSACAGDLFQANIVGRGASFSDYDRDGLVDAAVAVHNGAALLLRNTSPAQGHWLGVRLAGRGKNRWGVGAKATVKTASGSYVRPRLAGESYAGSNSATLHFGLGKETRVEEVEVRWPDGEVTRTGPVPADRIVRVQQRPASWEELPEERLVSRPWGSGNERAGDQQP
jgi:hypothetical protein